MKVLVIGSGGREHAFVWKLAQSPLVKEILCAPGGDGMEEARRCPVRADDLEGLLNLAQEEEVDLTVVGPEAPLCAGLVDIFQEAGLAVFGPARAGAELEGSKVMAKEFMARHSIPTAPFVVFDDPERARLHLAVHPGPKVVKADGLAAGKGVFVCDDTAQALAAVDEIMVHRAFGPAGDRILIEDRLEGEEASYIVVTDGEHVLPFPTSQDHKAVFDHDKGPNTGGMGAYSPAPVIDPVLEERILEEIIRPTVAGLAREGRPYQGFLYAGLMITPSGPQVLEFNCRLGDPEAQPLFLKLKSDLVEILEGALAGNLDRVRPVWDERAAVCVVMAAGGYPGGYDKGRPISGLEKAEATGAMVFHAGTAREGEGFVTAGGRVLGICALGEGLEAAVEAAYRAVDEITWEEAHFRTDIGAKALGRPVVGIVMGSDSDWPTLKPCSEKLTALGLAHEIKVMSAHRTPELAAGYARGAKSRGLKVLIAAAGGAAHLAGAVSAQTTLPVIGIPVAATPMGGMDALLATVQMPPGIPVATVALDKWGAINAAVLAAQIVSLGDPRLSARLQADKEKLKDKVFSGQARIDQELEGEA